MNFRRHLHRSDANQAEIVEFARAMGATVDLIGEPVDLLVGWKGRNLLWEVKRDKKAKLSPAQAKSFATWRGSLERIDSIEDAARSLGIELAHSPVG